MTRLGQVCPLTLHNQCVFLNSFFMHLSDKNNKTGYLSVQLNFSYFQCAVIDVLEYHVTWLQQLGFSPRQVR